MTGYAYVIASAKNGTIYNLHNKIYFNEKHAKNALKRMKQSHYLTNNHKVYKVTRFMLDEA